MHQRTRSKVTPGSSTGLTDQRHDVVGRLRTTPDDRVDRAAAGPGLSAGERSSVISVPPMSFRRAATDIASRSAPDVATLAGALKQDAGGRIARPGQSRKFLDRLHCTRFQPASPAADDVGGHPTLPRARHEARAWSVSRIRDVDARTSALTPSATDVERHDGIRAISHQAKVRASRPGLRRIGFSDLRWRGA